jgi:HAD superfamily hydrolase (TIGR01509 family)
MQTDKLIVFDLFGVVFTKGLDSSIDNLTAILNRPAEKVSKVYRKWEHQFDLGEIDENEFWSKVNSELKTNIKHKILNELVLSSYQIKQETLLLINYLKKNYTVVVYSNYRREWFEALDAKHRISNLFDKVYLSSDTKVLKPDARSFELIKNDYKVKPKDVLLIDDEERNIEGIKKWGWQRNTFQKYL